MANRYWVGGNADWDATAGTKWATSSGGSGGEAVPTSSDDVYLDNGTGTGNVTIGSGYTAACASLNCTGYLGTLAVGIQTINCVGNVTLASGMTITGTAATGLLQITGSTATLTANGKTWPCRLGFTGSTPTITLADAWSLTGQLRSSGTGDLTVNGYSFTAAGGTQLDRVHKGTTTLTLTGGEWRTQNWCEWSVTIAGDITLGSGTSEPNFRYGTLTYSSGTITQGTNDLNLMGGSVGTPTTLNTSGVTWYRAIMQGGGASTQYYSLSSVFNATTLAFLGGSSPIFVGAAGFTVGTLTNTSALDSNRPITLLQGKTYTVTTAITLAGNTTNHWTLTSSDANDVVFTFSGGTPPSLTLVKATHLDSSGGTAIYTDDTITSCLNWFNGAPSGGLMWI